MSGAAKVWNERRFLYSIYRVLNNAAWAKWLNILIHWASINRKVSGFSRYRHLKSEYLKICEAFCVNGCHGTESGVFAPKCEILAHKGSQTTRATPGDYLSSWNCKPMGRRDPMTSRFPVKSNPLQTRFFLYLDRSVKRWGGWQSGQSFQRQKREWYKIVTQYSECYQGVSF